MTAEEGIWEKKGRRGALSPDGFRIALVSASLSTAPPTRASPLRRLSLQYRRKLHPVLRLDIKSEPTILQAQGALREYEPELRRPEHLVKKRRVSCPGIRFRLKVGMERSGMT
jgi:hypothetical protein